MERARYRLRSAYVEYERERAAPIQALFTIRLAVSWRARFRMIFGIHPLDGLNFPARSIAKSGARRAMSISSRTSHFAACGITAAPGRIGLRRASGHCSEGHFPSIMRLVSER